MRHLKYFESTIKDDINQIYSKLNNYLYLDNISYEMTHEKIRKCSEIIQEKANINDENGFENWYTNNWCFEHKSNEEFFCKYYFHVIKKSDSVRLLKRYLLSNNIIFEVNNNIANEDEKKENIVISVISFSITKEQILYYLIENKNPNLSKMEIEMEIERLLEEERIDKTRNKFNL